MSSETNTKAVKAGAGYVIGNYLLKGITFLTVPVFSRLLTEAQYGVFSYYVTCEMMFYMILGITLHTSINSAQIKFKEKLDEYVSSIVALILLSAGIWMVLGNAFFDLYAKLLGFDRVVVNILIIHCTGSALLQVYNTYVSLSYKYIEYMKVCAFNAISNLVLSVILIVTLFNETRLMGRILGNALPIIVIGGYIVTYFFRKAKPVLKRDYWGYGLNYSVPTVPHGVSQVMLSTFDVVMIKNMVGDDANGSYGVAFNISALFKVVVTSLENIWKTWVFDRMEAKAYQEIREAGSKFTFGMTLFTGLVCLAAPEIVMVMADKDFWDASYCVAPIIVGAFFAFLFTLPAQIEYYYEKTKAVAVATMAAALVNVVLNWYGINKYGYVAAAYTTLITYFLLFLFHYVIAWVIHGKAIFDTLRIAEYSMLALVFGAMGIGFKEQWYIRWPIVILLGFFSLYWAEKNFKVISLVKKKVLKK